MPACVKCKQEKPVDGFYKHGLSVTGRDRTCKECRRRLVRVNRLKNIEYYRAYDRVRGARITSDDNRERRAASPEKYKARTSVGNAVRDGRLKKPDSCEECGTSGHLHGHHDDYTKPLDVTWLCVPCHKRRHKELGWGYVWNEGLYHAG